MEILNPHRELGSATDVGVGVEGEGTRAWIDGGRAMDRGTKLGDLNDCLVLIYERPRVWMGSTDSELDKEIFSPKETRRERR